jgi:hypothetical protein
MTKLYAGIVLMDEEERRLLTEWIEDLKIITKELRSLRRGSLIFWEVQKILEANPAALCHSLFNEWMKVNYGSATASGIRRQTDKDNRTISLNRLLTRIKAGLASRPDILSRESFKANYHPLLQDTGQRDFDRLVRAGAARVEPDYIDRDLNTLAQVTEGIKDFVDGRIAHRDAREIPNPKLGELDKCLDSLAEMTGRYSHLLTGARTSLTVQLPPDWKCVFKVAWIEPDKSDDRPEYNDI